MNEPVVSASCNTAASLAHENAEFAPCGTADSAPCGTAESLAHETAESVPLDVAVRRRPRGQRRPVRVDIWVAKVMHNYANLKAEDAATYGEGPVGWFWEQWRKQGGDFEMEGWHHRVTRAALCNITMVPLGVGGLHVPNCASVNNRNVALKGRDRHEAQDCELISASLNVAQQHASVKVLKQAFHVVVQAALAARRPGAGLAEQAFLAEVRRNWANAKNKAANGIVRKEMSQQEYNRRCWESDLGTIARVMCTQHLAEDKRMGRDTDIKPQDIYDLLLLQRGRCYYSGGLLTIHNGPMRFSVERLDNRVGHVCGNCVLISRMLNSHAGSSRAHFLEMMRSYRDHERA